MIYKNAQEAFEGIYDDLNSNGKPYSNTRAIFNYGFEILNPLDNEINTPWRKWSKDYADFEWEWYLSGDPSAKEIAKRGKIWESCMDADGNVNSNYGHQWMRGNQLEYVIKELTDYPDSRRAAISIYDGKDRHNFENDTPCTYAVQFYILDKKLQMSVLMRSNDIWFGFCNDQYCFSKLQEIVATRLEIEIGSYYHFATNMHVYERHLNENK